MTQALEDFFSGGVKAAKFEDRAFGTVIGGEILEDPRMQQQRDYESGTPLTYDDGNPQMQMVVVVQAYEPDGDDDGRRAFYIKGQMKQAVGEALRKHGEKLPRRGGRLFLRYREDKPTTLRNGKPGNPQKIHDAKYDPPANAAAASFMAEDRPTTSRGGAPSGGSQAAGAGGGSLPCPAGVDASRWAQMSDVQQEQMYDALGLVPPRAAPAGGAQFRDEPPF